MSNAFSPFWFDSDDDDGRNVSIETSTNQSPECEF